ncbi:DUF5362 family protein [Kosmotoga pacifica]|uniref:DUF5362 domain-containing protein n=1 Tax=Kosmotoga pacifica TaxID=1330330 RepID=A0A0G2ZE59_9BACT|nr:DUF5362 family protein [Kosmotoga pacifica]AKI97844.1 hypothetical protein IX53_08510 [Kosmotoga pacifica]
MAEGNKEVRLSFSTLKGLSYWAGFLGMWLIIAGIFAFIGGIIALGGGMGGIGPFLSGLISGGLTVFMGSKLRQAKKSIEEYMFSDNSIMLENGLDSMRVFFKVQGILIIIALVFAVVAIIAALSGVMMGFGHYY